LSRCIVLRKSEAVSAALRLAILGKLPPQARAIAITSVLGLGAGLIAVAFHLAIHAIYHHGIVAAGHGSRLHFVVGSFLIISVTSAAAGWLLTRFCPDAAGSGIPQVKLAFWKDFGVIPWRVVWVKFIGGALTVGGGCSLGREGPSVQLASGLASNLAGVLGIPKHQRRTAAAAGAAAGLAAAFNTPIAAVTFVLEEIIGDLNSRMLGSVLLASVLGALVVHGLLGAQPAFTLQSPGTPDWLGYGLTPVVAAVATLAGCWFQKAALGLRWVNKRPHRLPAWSRVMLGGIAVWAIGSAVFLGTGHLGVFSLGYEDLSSALNGDMVWHVAALLLVAKLVATAICYGLGGCGGIFAPTLFFGGMVGAMLSGLAGLVLPLSGADRVTLAVVGMCACLGGVVRAPITGILIVFEMTHEFALVPALIIAALISQGISRWLNERNFYDEVLAQDGHHVERIVPPRCLRTWMELPAARIANFSPVIATDLTPEAVRTLLATHRHERFPVVLQGRLRGVMERRAADLALRSAQSVPVETVATCLAETPLREVQSRLIDSPGQLAVVVDKIGEDVRVVGVITLHDLLRAEMLFAKEQED
jgi:CIC family chloride channel protein